MKIVAINSSVRGKKGLSNILIEKLFEGAKSQGAECEVVNLSELKINRCIHCDACQKPDRFLKCIYHDKDDVNHVFQKMASADLTLFSTPIYTFGMSSLLKVLIERYYSTASIKTFHMTNSGLFFHHTNREICGSPFALLIVYDNLENEMYKNVVSYFKSYSKFMEVEMIGTLIRRSAVMFHADLKDKKQSTIKDKVF